MKEFIEKLIGRLEKQAEQYRRRGFEHEQKGYSAMADKYYGKQCSYLHSIEIVNELAEEYNNGWIPCSERLPNKEEYLKNDGRFIVTDGNRVYQSIYDIYTHHYFRTLKFYNFGASEKSRYEIDNCVIAWMPLPQPYIEQQKELSTTWQQQTMRKFERVD